MPPPNRRLVEDAFAPLRAEADALRESIAALRGALGGATATAGGKGGSAASGLAAEAKGFIQLQKLVNDFKNITKGLKAGGSIAKALGLDEASVKLNAMSARVQLIGDLTNGIISSVRTLKVLFTPVVASVSLLVAGLVGVQQVVNRVTGTSKTLKETFVEFALQLKKGFAAGKVAAIDFYQTISGRTAESVEAFREAQSALAAVQREIEEEAAKAGQNGGRAAGDIADLTLAGVFAESKAQLVDLARGAVEAVEPILDSLTATLDQGVRNAQGILTPFEQFKVNLAQIGDLTTNTFNFIADGVQALSATIAGALLDAFLDPQQDIRETFGQLFRLMAQQLIQLLIQAALVRAIAGASGALGFSDGGAVPPAQGLAAGGTVLGGGRASLAHLFARGFALGGRPAGLPASDTVPAWLTPGEFVQPLGAVRRYGVQVMEALRTGAIDSGLMRALAAGVPAPAAIPTPRLGYASGGSVAGGAAAPEPVQAFLVPNEAFMDRALRAGPGATLRWMRENRSQIKSILG